MQKESNKQKPKMFGMLIRLLCGLLFSTVLAFSIAVSRIIDFQTALPFIAASATGALLSFFWTWFCKALAILRGKFWGRIVTNTIAVLISTFVLAFAILSIVMIVSANRQPQQNATLILLGCQVRGETPSLMLIRRLEAALAWLRDNEGASCVLSGGQGPGEDITEAECMRRWLTARGIQEYRLFLEELSTSTRENIQFSKDVIEANALSTNVAIATDGFHQHRAQMFAKQEGLTAGAVPAATPWWLLPFYWFREAVAIVVQVL